jgi:hypothetical protein
MQMLMVHKGVCRQLGQRLKVRTPAGAEADSNGEWNFKEGSGEDAFRNV